MRDEPMWSLCLLATLFADAEAPLPAPAAPAAAAPVAPAAPAGRDDPLQRPEVLWGVVGLAVALFAGAAVIYAVDRWRKQAAAGASDADEAGSLSSYRAMYESGEITEAEYTELRRRVADKVKPAAPKLPGAAAGAPTGARAAEIAAILATAAKPAPPPQPGERAAETPPAPPAGPPEPPPPPPAA